MEKRLITLIFCGLTFVAKSQNSSVEKSIYGVQIGYLGVWFHNELRLTDKIALRSELGLDGDYWNSKFNSGSGYTLEPVFTLEPRWYYNLEKRVSKSQNIEGNSSNFFSLKTSYQPEWFLISNVDFFRVERQISIVPTWGIKRNIGNHFNYETGIGMGVLYRRITLFDTDEEILPALNFHMRIGYRF